MKRSAVGLVFALTVVSSAGAQGTHPAIEGDVYLTMQSGDVRKLAGNTVEAIPRAAFLDARAAVCGNQGTVDSLIAKNDYAKLADINAKAKKPLADRLASIPTTKSPTGMQAHYHFDSLPSGDYILHAGTQIGTRHYYWIVPATVSSGKPMSLDLDNSNVHQLFLACADVF